MDANAHTTPEARNALMKYLRDRRMTTSIHQTITVQALNDLDEALRLLRGAREGSEAWLGETEAFLAKVTPCKQAVGALPLPGLLEGSLWRLGLAATTTSG